MIIVNVKDLRFLTFWCPFFFFYFNCLSPLLCFLFCILYYSCNLFMSLVVSCKVNYYRSILPNAPTLSFTKLLECSVYIGPIISMSLPYTALCREPNKLYRVLNSSNMLRVKVHDCFVFRFSVDIKL